MVMRARRYDSEGVAITQRVFLKTDAGKEKIATMLALAAIYDEFRKREFAGIKRIGVERDRITLEVYLFEDEPDVDAYLERLRAHYENAIRSVVAHRYLYSNDGAGYDIAKTQARTDWPEEAVLFAANWIETAAQNDRNRQYWEERALRAEKELREKHHYTTSQLHELPSVTPSRILSISTDDE